MKPFILTGLTLFSIAVSSCSTKIEPKELYGRWNYVKVDNTDPRDTLATGELEEQSPAIIFTKEQELIIEWGGKRLSHGKFTMDGKMIRYTEDLGGNRKREFPFLINKLNDKELIFSTMEQNLTTVTAVKN